jgi:hypothetical protein
MLWQGFGKALANSVKALAKLWRDFGKALANSVKALAKLWRGFGKALTDSVILGKRHVFHESVSLLSNTSSRDVM